MSVANLRVLNADRNSFYRRIIRQNLAPSRMLDMHEAESALDAMSLLLSHPFDLMIVDWELLIANEGALLELVVRRARSARRKMPVLAMMAQTTQANVLHAANNAVDLVLRKPFSPKMLQQRVGWLLERIEADVAV